MISPFLTSGFGFQKANHLGAQRVEIAGGTGDAITQRCEWKTARSRRPTRRCATWSTKSIGCGTRSNYRERSVFKLVPAEIVTRDSSTWWRTVTINRGKEDGIESDMPVVTDEGLVGKTTTVSANISVVLLSRMKIAGSRPRWKERASRESFRANGSRGAVTPLLDLNFLSKQANLKPGQKAYTSGVGGVFPSGLLIGTVQSFQRARTGWSGAAGSRQSICRISRTCLW